MKNTIKLFGIIVLVTVIVFPIASCKGKSGGSRTVDKPTSSTGTSKAVAVPTKITIEDPRDIPFLHKDSRIKVGETYEITVDAWFSQLSGTMLILAMKGDQWTADTFSITTNSRIPEFERAAPVHAVFLYKPGSLVPDQSYINSELVSIEKR